MKHLEFNHNGNWIDKLLNNSFFCIDDTSVHTFGLALGFKENGIWNYKPRITGTAQFYNAVFFVRLGFPALFIGVRFTETHLFQCGIGWKQSGRFAILFRFQTDTSSAQGYHAGMPNTGQATGFDYGPH